MVTMVTKSGEFIQITMSAGTGTGPGVLNRRVRVVVRTRPTANFAHDLIQLEEDGKV